MIRVALRILLNLEVVCDDSPVILSRESIKVFSSGLGGVLSVGRLVRISVIYVASVTL